MWNLSLVCPCCTEHSDTWEVVWEPVWLRQSSWGRLTSALGRLGWFCSSSVQLAAAAVLALKTTVVAAYCRHTSRIKQAFSVALALREIQRDVERLLILQGSVGNRTAPVWRDVWSLSLL